MLIDGSCLDIISHFSPRPWRLLSKSSNGSMLVRWLGAQCYVSVKIFLFFFFNKFIHFNWRLITLQYCSGFSIHCCESATGVHVFPILNHHPIPRGHPSAPALSNLSHVLNLDWQSISHMLIYMFRCHSPKSSHPHPLPQSPKGCSIHLCLFCCLAYRVITTIFLNSIYMP